MIFSIHYRAARNNRQTRVHLVQGIEKLIPRPRRIPGKCVENILPATAPDKGTAIRYLLDLSGSSMGLYVGDDAADEEVSGWMETASLQYASEQGAGVEPDTGCGSSRKSPDYSKKSIGGFDDYRFSVPAIFCQDHLFRTIHAVTPICVIIDGVKGNFLDDFQNLSPIPGRTARQLFHLPAAGK